MEVAESVTSLSVMPVKDEQAPHDYVNAIEQRLSRLEARPCSAGHLELLSDLRSKGP